MLVAGIVFIRRYIFSIPVEREKNAISKLELRRFALFFVLHNTVNANKAFCYHAKEE